MTLINLNKAPFPWFGGKSKAASLVWALLGDVDHYAEPFFGSGAVLLNRPHPCNRPYHSETVNDLDGFLVNLWRSTQWQPEATARAASREALGYALAVTAVPAPAHRGWERAVAWQRASVAAAEGAWDVSDAAVTAAERLDRITRGEVERRYDVRDGDTLESIARTELGDALRAGEIARRNNLPGHRVQAGQRLFLPVR